MTYVYVVVDGTGYPIYAWDTLSPATKRIAEHNKEYPDQPLWYVIRLYIRKDGIDD